MTDNMVRIQTKIKEQAQIKLLSFSVTPQIDSVAQLKKYALEKGVLDEYWNLLTGDKKEIYTLARKSYFVVKDDGDGGPFDMIHTENFVLVDPERRIRGYYDGTDLEAMETLWDDIQVLQKEYPIDSN
jgi:protein SCO1/2